MKGLAQRGGKSTVVVQVGVDVMDRMRGLEAAKRTTRAHRRIMKNLCSPLLFGPPECDEILALVTHMFTEDEADLAQHLPPLIPLTARQISFFSGRSAADVTKVMENLCMNKGVVYYLGEPRKYTMIPLIQGLFEMVLVSTDMSKNTPWHREFARLFEEVWETEFVTEYIELSRSARPPHVRYMPARGSLSKLQSAWPCDMLDELLDPYDVFGIAHCQCRTMMQLTDKGCGKPTLACVSMGPIAEDFIARGFMRKVDRREIIEAKQIAEDNGCVTWMMNRENGKEGNISCSCCGCCCYAMRTITQFNTPGFISPPHFMPKISHDACKMCGRCVTACPMGAWKKGETAMSFEASRCVGCGLCVKACNHGALEMRVTGSSKKPARDNNSLMIESFPAFVSTAFRIWLRRTAGIG